MNRGATSSVKKASFIAGVSRYSVVGINLLITMALARILTPEEFGTVAVVSVFTTFFSLIADFGLGRGVIQDRDLTDEEVSGVYTVNVWISLAIGLIFVPFSYVLAAVYSNTIYVSFAPFLATALFFNSMASIPSAICLREKRFLAVGATGLVSAILGGTLAICTALAGAGVYALVLQSLISAACGEIILEFFARQTWHLCFRFRPALSGLKRMLGYSMGQFGFNVVNYFARNLDNILVGKTMGAEALGFYDKAYKLTTFPVTHLTGVISGTLHPILAEHQADVGYIYDRYIPVVRFLSLVAAFISPFFCFSARELIALMFGDAWGSSVTPLAFLSLSMWFQMTSSSCGAIYQSVGHTDVMLKSSLIFVPVQVVAIIVGVFSGSLGVCALSVALSFVAKFLIEYWFLIHVCFGRGYLPFLRMFIPDFAVALCTAAPLAFLNMWGVLNLIHPVVSLLIRVVIAGLTYLCALKVSGQGRFLIGALPGVLSKRLSWLG